jgi:hypothetical protein
MAKVTPGPLAGLVSGKVGNVVFSHGRYGPYIRSRVMPTLVQNDYTSDVRGRLIDLSRAWGPLGASEKAAWGTWAATHPVLDRLGYSRVLQPSAAFIQLNARAMQAGGAQLNLPPLVGAPASVTALVLTVAETGPVFEVDWASGPIGGTECIAAWVAVYDGAGRSYYRNLMKLVKVVQPGIYEYIEIPTEVELRFGPLVKDLLVKCELEVWDNATGLKSTKSFCEAVVAA